MVKIIHITRLTDTATSSVKELILHDSIADIQHYAACLMSPTIEIFGW
jgi:hypothetical protein